MKIQKPTIGRVVEVALRDPTRGTTARRPAFITAVEMGGADGINCRPILDGCNDKGVECTTDDSQCFWVTSIRHNGDGVIPEGQQASWRYPPRCTDEIDVDA